MTGTGLIRYDAAIAALAEAKTVFETRVLRDKAEGLRAYARLANDRGLELDALEIRVRAERRIGEMLADMPGVGRGGWRGNQWVRQSSSEEPTTLKDLGIDKKLSMRAQAYAAVPEAEFERRVAAWRAELAAAHGRGVSAMLKAIARPAPPDPPPLETMLCGPGYAAILADPPWPFDTWSDRGKDRGAENHYPSMSIDDISALPVADLAAPDALLFLWATWPRLPDALWVMESWGFQYKTGGAWRKLSAAGRTAVGTGYLMRSSCEPFLLGVRGDPPIVRGAHANLIEAMRREHSRKPDAVYGMIADMMVVRGPFLELFARGTPAKGWKAWGNQMTEARSQKSEEPE